MGEDHFGFLRPRELAHVQNRAAQIPRYGPLRIPHTGQLGHVLGQVACAFQCGYLILAVASCWRHH